MPCQNPILDNGNIKCFERCYMKTILVSGANGFIATNFCQKFSSKYNFILLNHKLHADELQGNHINLKQLSNNQKLLNSIDVVINLAGANIGAKLWTKSRKEEIISSRMVSTKCLVELFNKNNHKVHFISASAVGVYDFNLINDEYTLINYNEYKSFSQQITKEWEQQAFKYIGLTTILRLGVVLSSKGGAFEKILLPFKFGLGGKIGSGQQAFPWVALDDLLSLMELVIDKSFGGIFNVTSPHLINNEQLTYAIAKVWHRPAFIKIPAWLIKLLLGQMGDELLLKGQYVISKRLKDISFEFKYPYITNCLQTIKNQDI